MSTNSISKYSTKQVETNTPLKTLDEFKEFNKKLIQLFDGKEPTIQEINLALLDTITMNGDYDVVELLIKAGADVNFKSVVGWETPLMRAAENGYYEIVVLLLKSGAEVNFKNRNGSIALIKAVDKGNGNEKIVQMLIEAGSNVNFQCGWRETALIQAAKNGYYEIAVLLIKLGANVNLQDIIGKSALMYAVHWNHDKIVKLLMMAKADLNLQNHFGETASDFVRNPEIFVLLQKERLVETLVNCYESEVFPIPTAGGHIRLYHDIAEFIYGK
jgi:ankyrin repeat protein